MSDFRVDLLEQKVTLMQKEVSDVLQEMQTTIMAITQTYSTALKVLVERADKSDVAMAGLLDQLGKLDVEMKRLLSSSELKETPKNETGIEL